MVNSSKLALIKLSIFLYFLANILANITVEIKNGGISFIKVTDNGKGIAQDDLEIAFERHATSKIRTADDLDVVTSMGFRGEALASIAAIANVELVSKTEEQQVGYKVVVEAGDILSKEEIGCQKGTSITVRNLFFNTPVRYKFLKKDYTESGYIEDVITRIALVNPNIAIKLINTGKTVIQTNGNGDIKSVIYSIYGKDVATGVMPVEYAYDDIQVSGVIGKPEIARSNRSNQLFFVNKRYIKDKTLSAATEQAYKGLIPIGKFGFVVLNITMNPAKVDVNVHPAKLEVRFEDESKIFQSIYHAIKDTLLKGELVASTEKQEINQNKEEISKGLYDFRKNETEKIEQYTNEESKIKTNNIVQDIYNKVQQNAQTQAVKVPHVNLGEGGPVNTADVLEQLKKLQENIQKEVETDPSIKLNSNYIQMREQQGNQTKVETSIENDEVKVENNTDTENTNIQEQKIETPTEIKENTETEIEENAQIDNTKSNEIKPEEKPEENQQEEVKPTESFDEMYAKLFGTKPISQEQIETKSNLQEEVIPIKPEIPSIDMKKENVSIFEQNEENQKPTYKFIGIVFNTYIILEIDKEMYILDQHAAHERIMYEKVKNNYYSDSSKDSQMLLLPDIITLTHKEMEIAKDNMEMFKKAGFSLEEFGENTIKLTGVPTVCIDLDNKELFLETLDEINTVARTAKQEKEERFIATVACKAAVKANMVLTREEVESLMDKLLALPNPFTCPHGRPTAIKMSKYDIERKFARK